jgi:acetyl-CoA decarbonylase/synthase complex subunit gamma
MKLATGGAEVSACKYLSDDIRAQIEELLAPPIRPVTIGKDDKALVIGDEEVMYRHEKTFFHQPGIGCLISDTEDAKEQERKIKALKEMRFIWIGRTLKADLAVVQCASGDKGKFSALVKKVAEIGEGIPI